jgi:ATP-dependent helicase/nuclease subunit B
MPLRFILGRAGSGKTELCLREIRTELAARPDGCPLIYLVPEQMTFQSEYLLSTTPELGGNIRAQVLSFTRLAFRIMGETGGLTRSHLTSTGLKMVLCRILEKQKKNLRLFHRASEQAGFTGQLEEILTELKHYCVLPEKLAAGGIKLQPDSGEAGNSGNGDRVLQDKLHDLALIYKELEQELAGRYLYGEDYLPLLAERLSLSAYINKAEIWIDGFHFFTPQELLVINRLLTCCERVTVTLTVDKPYDHGLPHEFSLFYQTAQTYQTLHQAAMMGGSQLEQTVLLPEEPGAVPTRFARQQDLAHLEKYFDSRPAVPCQEGCPGITLAAAVNRRTEVEHAAREILTLVRDGGYRFRDLAVMTRDLSLYHDLIRTVFHDDGIPLFLDRKRPMLYHPLVEFIRSAVEVVNKNWNYEAVFRCIKTDLLFPLAKWENIDQLREEMDQLENYVVAFGISGSRWTAAKPWEYGRKKDIPLQNRLRQLVNRPLVHFQRDLRNAKNGQAMGTALFKLLESLDIPAKLERWQQQARQGGHLAQAREHAQVWRAVLELLDQMVEVLGEEKIPVGLFARLLEAGLESMHFALVPPALDQVLAATLDRSRLSNVKCVFLLGVNDGVLPTRIQEQGIFTEEEKLALTGKTGIRLGPDSRRKLLDEQFLIYNGLTRAADKLWLSYSLADEEGKALLPSSLVNQLKKLFPELREQMLYAGPGEDRREKENLDITFVSRPGETLSYLASSLRRWRQGYPLSPLWWDVYNWYMEHDRWRDKGSELLRGLFYQNRENSLKYQTAQGLYGRYLQVSVTRVEKFMACPFAQFASHGLKLKKRQVFRLEAPDIGQLFHEALTLFAKYVEDSKLDWHKLTEEECFRLAGEAVDQLAPKIQGEILLSSNRYHYLTGKLKEIVGRSAAVIGRQLARGQFQPVGLELGFGPGETLPSLHFTLENGCELELIGRIDRVDQAVTDQGIYLRVVDYKSSDQKLDLAEVFFGLSLQVLTYLDVVITNGAAWLGQAVHPAGVLYFHLQNPLYPLKKMLTEEQLERELFKKFKMKGLVLADQEVVRLMDLENVTDSEIVPVKIKQNGDFDKRASVIKPVELEALRAHVREIYREAGSKITEGEIAISPYRLNKKKPCTYCLYKSFCQFDQALAENRFRVLPADKKEAILEKLVQEGGVKAGE